MSVCCTQSFETSYYNCLLCVGIALNATDYIQAQADLNGLYVSCSDYGYSLQELTLPGQDAHTISSRARTSSVVDETAVPLAEVDVPEEASEILEDNMVVVRADVPDADPSPPSPPPSSPPPPPPSSSGAALGLSTGGSRVLASVSATVGLIVLWNS
ncbi:uncharacterized protein F5147DRAFT_431413 [Suillus discolor]|uniref:Uncharacterized protein n=1 Tax=Suillus discolor TaxID=1912936 RepID=A0A9P7FG30_9AGAM|nr:uncharacterized protein F5147DRAFT_431413 [Suillus discolor]KAG2114746.1 hypothetical protein F5147DRAFT_431413 [Suillus discolor]